MIKDRKRSDIDPDMEQIIEDAPAVEQPEENREPKKPVVKKSVDRDAWIARKLKVINELPDGAKKRNAAERVLKNKEVKNGKM